MEKLYEVRLSLTWEQLYALQDVLSEAKENAIIRYARTGNEKASRRAELCSQLLEPILHVFVKAWDDAARYK